MAYFKCKVFLYKKRARQKNVTRNEYLAEMRFDCAYLLWKNKPGDVYMSVDAVDMKIQTKSFPPETNPLYQYIGSRVIEEKLPEEKARSSCVRKSLIVTSFVAAIFARISYVPLALRDSSSKEYGWFLATSMCVSFSILVFECFLNILQDIMSPMTKEEKVLKASTIPTSKKTAILVAAVIAGVVAQVPFAQIASKYNKPSNLNPDNAVAPAMLLGVDSNVTIYFAYLLFCAFYRNRLLKPGEKEMQAKKLTLASLIQDAAYRITRDDLPNVSSSGERYLPIQEGAIRDVMKDWDQIKTSNKPLKEKVEDMIRSILPEEKKGPTPCSITAFQWMAG